MTADIYRSPAARETVERGYREQLTRWTIPLRRRMLDSHDTAARVTRLLPTASVNLRVGAGHGVLDDGGDLHNFLRRGVTP
jgi:hypothetical protein